MSRKLAKENLILILILLSTLILPIPGMAENTIQTTQKLIVLDPGHGGTMTGLVSSGGIKEKALVLTLAQKTAQALENRYNVLLTRTGDTDTPFRERIALANRNRAALFVSIHLHQSPLPSVFLYYFDPPGSNRPLPQVSASEWKSQPLAHQAGNRQAVDSFSSIFSAGKPGLKITSTGAPVLFLEGATMPAMMIEALSISTLPRNPDERETTLDAYAALISNGIDLYFGRSKDLP